MDSNSRILIFSQRNLKLQVFRSYIYEFEDVISAVDQVDLVSPTWFPPLFRAANGLSNFSRRAGTIGESINTAFNKFEVKKKYKLFFAFFQSPYDIISLNSIKNWRKKCDIAVCWLDEIWLKEIEKVKSFLKPLKGFDYVFMNFSSSVDAVADIVQRPCHHIPYGVDAIRFCPYPLKPDRCINVYNIGRRSPVIHKSLLKLAEEQNFFYVHDTISNMSHRHGDIYTLNYQEHRTVYSNLIKRSRYFIVNKAKFDSISQSGEQEEFGTRFFEGAAGGAVMIGVPPASKAYNQHFDWSDAVTPIPYEATNLTDILAELDRQPERRARIHQDNVVNSLLRHDWVYRWAQILEVVGLENTSEMVHRIAHLKKLSEYSSEESLS